MTGKEVADRVSGGMVTVLLAVFGVGTFIAVGHDREAREANEAARVEQIRRDERLRLLRESDPRIAAFLDGVGTIGSLK